MTALPLLVAISFLPYFEARNAVANLILEPPPEGAPAIKAELPGLTVHADCPACDGAGELVLQEPDFGQSKGRLGNAKKVRRKCPLCDGRGKRDAFTDPAALELQVARDYGTFTTEHQGRGEIAAGAAFVPSGIYEKSDRKRLKLVEEAFGKPCAKCRWTGIETCRKCSGRGVTECPEKDCRGGFLVTQTTTEKTYTKSGGSIFGNGRNGGRRSSGNRRTTKKETKVTVQICPTCEGAKFLVCPECGGRKAKPCKSCGGLGVKQKAGTR